MSVNDLRSSSFVFEGVLHLEVDETDEDDEDNEDDNDDNDFDNGFAFANEGDDVC